MTAPTDWLVGIGSSVIAGAVAAGGFFSGKRKTSGSIKTSEAVDLWRESGEIRKLLTERVAYLEKRVDEMQEELNTMREKSIRDDAELARLRP